MLHFAIHTPTKEEYDNVMQILEDKEILFPSKAKPTSIDFFKSFKEKSVIFFDAGGELSYGGLGVNSIDMFSGYRIMNTKEGIEHIERN
jgi:hypothetical protein